MLRKIQNEKTIGLIFDKPFLFQNHIFVPLSNSYDFYMESEYMKNCVKGKEALSYIYRYVKDYNLSLFFHIVDINNLDKQWMEQIGINHIITQQLCTTNQSNTRLELDKSMDFLTIDTTLCEVHQNTKSSEQSMLTHINSQTAMLLRMSSLARSPSGSVAMMKVLTAMAFFSNGLNF